jgi:hypothetical protein
MVTRSTGKIPPHAPIEITFGIFGEILEIWYVDPHGGRIEKIPEGRFHLLTTTTDPRTGKTISQLEGPVEIDGQQNWQMAYVTITRIIRRIGGGSGQ